MDAATITIDTSRRQPQQWEGWGVSLCWWAHMCGKYSEEHLDSLITWLTDPEGLNYNIFRYNIGGGDDPNWTNCHKHHMAGRGGKGIRAEMQGFQDADGTYHWQNDAGQKRVLQMIVRKRPDAILEAFSNSAPWWMTKSGCVGGGKPATADNLRDDMYQTFADYLVNVCRYYRDSLGITFRTLEPFNESLTNYWYQSGSQEGCHFSIPAQIKMVKTLYPILKASGLPTTISASDETSVVQSIEAFRAYKEAGILPMISQWNTHTYSATDSLRQVLRNNVTTDGTSFGGLLWQSETGDGGRGLNGNLRMARRLIADVRHLQPSAWLDWQYLEENFDQWSLVKGDHHWQKYTRHKNYYVRQHFSRFVPQGSHWLITDDEGQNNYLAALSPDEKTLSVIIVNATREMKNYDINIPNGWQLTKTYLTDHNNSMANADFHGTLYPNSIVTLIYSKQ